MYRAKEITAGMKRVWADKVSFGMGNMIEVY
jgi:hypothetical protein